MSVDVSVVDCFWHLLSFAFIFCARVCAFLMAVNSVRVFLSIDPFIMLGFAGQVGSSAGCGPVHFAHCLGQS